MSDIMIDRAPSDGHACHGCGGRDHILYTIATRHATVTELCLFCMEDLCAAVGRWARKENRRPDESERRV